MKTRRTLADWALTLNRRAGGDARLPACLLLTDRDRVADPAPAITRLPRGSAVIYRDYQAEDRALRAAALRRLCRRLDHLFLVAGDARLATTVEADGLHLPEARMDDAMAIRRRHPEWLITCAAHDARALNRAKSVGVDAALLSPVFETASHPGAAVLGAPGFLRIARRAPLPVYALGGVTAENAGELERSGAVGIAAIGGWQQTGA